MSRISTIASSAENSFVSLANLHRSNHVDGIHAQQGFVFDGDKNGKP